MGANRISEATERVAPEAMPNSILTVLGLASKKGVKKDAGKAATIPE